jgi:hypothetical protein
MAEDSNVAVEQLELLDGRQTRGDALQTNCFDPRRTTGRPRQPAGLAPVRHRLASRPASPQQALPLPATVSPPGRPRPPRPGPPQSRHPARPTPAGLARPTVVSPPGRSRPGLPPSRHLAGPPTSHPYLPLSTQHRPLTSPPDPASPPWQKHLATSDIDGRMAPGTPAGAAAGTCQTLNPNKKNPKPKTQNPKP